MDALVWLAVMTLFLGALSSLFFFALWAVKFTARALDVANSPAERWRQACFAVLCASGFVLGPCAAYALTFLLMFSLYGLP